LFRNCGQYAIVLDLDRYAARLANLGQSVGARASAPLHG
jgi:hypothetical protein